MMNNLHHSSPQTQHTMTVASLLSQRQWILLESLLTSTNRSAIQIDDLSLPHAITADIVIHFAARFQAPLRILSLLSRMYPQSLASPDITGRYPIHVAAKWSATPDVIAYLIKTNPSVAGLPDSTGKTPMHYVGEWYIQHFDNALYSCDDSMLQVVRLLRNAAPLSVNLEDDEGSNAIEYALASDAHLKVIKTMQRACRDDWRERSRVNKGLVDDISDDEDAVIEQKPVQLGRRRHNDLVRDIEKMSCKLQKEYSSDRSLMSDKSSNERVHVHRSRTLANTQAARTA